MEKIQTSATRGFEDIAKDLSAAEKELWRLVRHDKGSITERLAGIFRGGEKSLDKENNIAEKELELRIKLKELLAEIKEGGYAWELFLKYAYEGQRTDKLYGVDFSEIACRVETENSYMEPYYITSAAITGMSMIYTPIQYKSCEHNFEVAGELLDNMINANDSLIENLSMLSLLRTQKE
ncbi:MAG: hypothetical protein QXW10_02050 [Candidatus Micrarchaeaceae archaeon]